MPRIQIYTTHWCGFCVRAKTLLDSRRLPYEEISLDDDPAFRQTVFDATGGWTVPQILVDGQPIGGYTELWRLDREGRLDELLAARAGWHVRQNQGGRPATRVRAVSVPPAAHRSSRRPV